MSICFTFRRAAFSSVKQIRKNRLSLVANMSMKAVVIHEYGDSSKLSYEDVPIPEPGPNEVLVKNHFAGLNFIDTYVRKGIMKIVQPGGIMGFEGAGTVEKLGSGVQGLSVGDRVAFAFIGSRAFVIGTTSTEAKAAKAREAGADEVILYSQKDFVEEVNRITDGKGVNAIYDGVGKTTFHKNFGCLARRGTVVAFGGASGSPEPLDIGVLAKGSFYVTYGVNFHFVDDPAEYSQRATELFTWLSEGKLKFSGGITVVPLSDAKKAHEMLEGRQTTGKVLLQP